MAENPYSSTMAGGTTSGASPIDAGLSKASTGLSKVIAQLTKVESLLKSIGDKSSYIGKHSKGADISGGSSMMPSSFGAFSTSHASGGNMLEGSLGKFTVGQIGLSIAGAAYASLPTTSTAMAMGGSSSAASALFLDSYNPKNLRSMAEASFGNNASSSVSASQAAFAINASGMNINSAGGRSLAATAGVAFQTLGMDNVTAASALTNTFGVQQSNGLFAMGINNRDSKGNPLSMTQIVNQMYRGLYGNRKNVTSDMIGSSFQAGQFHSMLSYAGITDPNEQLIYRTQLEAKALAMRNGTTYDSTQVPSQLKSKSDNPYLGLGRANAGKSKALDAGLPGFISGMNDANDAIGKFNDALGTAILDLGSFGQNLTSAKGFGDTVAGDPVGQAGHNIISDIGGYFASRGLMHGLSSGLGKVGGSAGKHMVQDAAAYVGKHLLGPVSRKSPFAAAKSVLSRIGAKAASIPLLGGLLSRLGMGGLAEGAAGIAGASGPRTVGSIVTYGALDTAENYINSTLGADPNGNPIGRGIASFGRIGFDTLKVGATGLVAGGPSAGELGLGLGFGQGLYNAFTGQGIDYGSKGSVNSYAVGAYNLPKDEVAQVHKGEMILPASIAQAVRTSMNNSSSTRTTPTNVTIQVMLANGADSEVMRVGRKIKSIIEDPSTAASMKDR